MKRIIKIPLLASAVLLTACGGGSSGSDASPTSTDTSAKDQPVKVPSLSLATTTYQLVTEKPFSLSVANSGGTPSTCTATPNLPEGLYLAPSQKSCLLAGATLSALASTDYKVTATNSAGASSIILTLAVEEPTLLAPSLTQTELSDVISVGDTFLLDLMNQGGVVSECTSQPDLPAGLSVDVVAGSCVVNGYTVVVREQADYDISAINSAGQDSLSLTLEVQPQPPEAPAFTALDSNFFRWQQNQIVALALQNTGGEITTCSVTPDLPVGLSLVRQQFSCAILGTADVAQASARYRIVGSNSTGSSEQAVIIEVEENMAYTGDGPDPEAYDHVLVLAENRNINAGVVALHTDINAPEAILQLSSTGFPNRLLQVQSSDGELLTEASEIDRLFRLFIDPTTGIVEIRVQKTFDFERDAAFYSIDLQLGDETLKLLLRLYDIQKGNEAEPLTISSYEELVSFLEGRFVDDHIGFDLIDLSVTSGQNEADMSVRMDRDIDARRTQQAGQHWPGYRLRGQLDGGKHVIRGLKLADRAHFLSQPARLYAMKIRNLGLTELEANNAVFYALNSSSRTEGVFIEGVLNLRDNDRVNDAPLTMPGRLQRVYTNMYIDIGPGRDDERMQASAFNISRAATASLLSGYSNGRIVSEGNEPMFGNFAGFMLGSNMSNGAPAQFISAVMFDINNPAREFSDGSYLRIAGFGDSRLRPPTPIGGSASPWRFIKDRNNSAIVRHVGNYTRDTNNDGIADDGAVAPNWETAGMLEADAKRASGFTGVWSNGDFDLTDGYVPVLKNMPYPHTPGASWMSAPDPGVAYQHHMYDYYLQDPR